MLRYLRRANLFAVFLCTYLSVAIGAPPVIWGPNSSVQTLTQRGLLVGDQLQQSGNLVLNPSAFKGTSSVTTSNATATRSPTTPISISGVAEWNVTITSANGTVTWSSAPSAQWEGLKGQNCEARFRFRGFQTTTVFQVIAGSNVIGQLSPATISTTNAQTGSINFPCGDMTNVPQFRVTDTATLSGINEIAEIYLGAPTNMTDVNVITNWRSYTPTFTGFGTVTTIESFWRRVGDSVELKIAGVTGTPTATTALITLPNNYTIGTLNTTNYAVLGKYARGVGTISTFKQGVVLGKSGETALRFSLDDYTTARNPFSPANGDALFGSGEGISFSVTVPIAGLNAELAVTPGSQNVWGGITFTGSATVSITASSFSTYNDAAYATNTTYGNATAPTSTCGSGANNLGICVPNLPAGQYRVKFNGAMFAESGTTATSCIWQIIDDDGNVGGTAQARTETGASQYDFTGDMEAVFNYTSFKSLMGWRIRALRDAGDGNCRIALDSAAGSQRRLQMIVDPLNRTNITPVYVQGPVRGANTGDTIPTGYVGEVRTLVFNTINANTSSWTASSNGIALPAGTWLITGRVNLSGAASSTGAGLNIATNGNNDSTGFILDVTTIYDPAFGGGWPLNQITFTTPGTTLYAKAFSYGAARTAQVTAYATRLN